MSFCCASEAEGVALINACIHGLYHEGVFIPSERAVDLARKGLRFLRLYAELALECFKRSKKRFPLIPKGHFLHHSFLDLLEQSLSNPDGWTVNVLIYACQSQEDFVGRPSRIARRVNPRTTSLRVLQRVFLAVRSKLWPKGKDDP